MANAAKLVIEVPAPSGYGASELKELIRKYTVRGFIMTVALTLLLLLLYVGIQMRNESAKTAPKLAPIVKVTLDQLPSADAAEVAPPPPPQEIISTGPAARAGTPIGVPDAQITADMKDFATIDVMSRASSVGGDGVDLGGFSSNINIGEKREIKIEHKEAEPAPDDFIPVEKEPGVDLGKLQKSIVYPDLARRANVEGRVVVRVLVGSDGRARKYFIESSDHELLNQAALDAIKNYGLFTPAIQNGNAITCWVSIPITFRLR
ncbi:MAG TPA: energy transducer TonB [Candidatus Kapabacteria bacterium]|nr:energy transducer TonB [Candidatus Kapabacteria bacterium]